MRNILLLLFAFISIHASAQPKAQPSSSIFQKIKKLKVLGSVLYVAAHPDDENTRLIAWLGNERLYRTAYLSMTRGDGGQNLIGDEQGVELGLIRTQELLAARRIDGGEQFFTRAFDFGYSKSPQETFDIWGKEKILSDVVWIIRKFRPDIIITRFPTTGEGGHGHHTASAILAEEAFDAAGDSSRFRDQLKEGVTTWTPRRLLWNTFNFGSSNTIRKDQFHVDAGGYNPLLGESYGEIAAESRSQHKSQGFGVSASRGSQPEYFKTIRGTEPDRYLMDGVDLSWNRIGQPQIAFQIDEILKNFTFQEPQNSVAALLNLYRAIAGLPGSYWRDKKLGEVNQLIQECAGLFMEAFTGTQFFVPGREMDFILSITSQLGVKTSVSSITFFEKALAWQSALPVDKTVNQAFNVVLPQSTPISQPYWLTEPMAEGSFTVNNQQFIGMPENKPLSVHLTIDFDGTQIPYILPLRFKSNDPVKGEVYQPVFIIPAVDIQSFPAIAVSRNRSPVEVNTSVVKNDSAVIVNNVLRDAGKSINLAPGSQNKFFVTRPNEVVTIQFAAETSGGIYDRYKVFIDYPHIPDIIYFPKAESRIVGVDLQTAGRTAGFIPGAGDKIPEALAQLGYEVTTLTKDDFAPDRLRHFDVIVAGVRAYNIHEWLNDVYPALMNYVQGGGVLFVQYNTNNNLGPVKAKIGPYPFDISRTRVTDEDAVVKFVNPRSNLLNYPNKITAADFKNWVQERSTYHAAGFEGNYSTLFSMHDPGEKPDEGSLIYCDYGKGRFVYSGLVFFRELPAGNPGAYRLFSNLIAKPKK